MGMQGLAEGIIMQSIEDLWNENLRDECVAFFKGKEFRICAELAGMGLDDQVKVLNLVKGVLDDSAVVTKRKAAFAEKAGRPEKTPKRVSRFMHATP